MDFKFNFGSADAGTDFKFNFGSADDAPGKPSGAEDHVTPDGFLVPRQMKVDWQADVPDEETVEALFEDIAFNGRAPLKRCRPPNSGCLEGPIAEAIQNSDLVPGVYEGGFKVWECSIDLVNHLVDTQVELKDLRVIELGCGQGLPGIHALQQGAVVDFQDYNPEVLTEVTIPNIQVNCPNPPAPPKVFSGDWGQLPAAIARAEEGESASDGDLGSGPAVGEGQYDVVLTAETIYDVQSAGRLIECTRRLLKPSGVAYIAAKSYYFGVGGSTRQFEAQVAERERERRLERVGHWQDGTSNVREVLRLGPVVGAE